MLAAGAALQFVKKNPKLAQKAANLAVKAANDPKVKKAALTALSKGGGGMGTMNGLVQAAIGK